MTIRQLLAQEWPQKTRLSVNGWIQNKRKSKTVSFMELIDGSSLRGLQCVIPHGHHSNTDSMQHDLSVGAAVRVDGEMVASEGAGQSYELQVDSLRVEGVCNPTEYPLQAKRHSLDFLRSLPNLRHRTKVFRSVYKIRHETTMAIHNFFNVLLSC